MYVIVIGGGHVGYYLTKTLAQVTSITEKVAQ